MAGEEFKGLPDMGSRFFQLNNLCVEAGKKQKLPVHKVHDRDPMMGT